jgi:hypothetical protein
MNQRAKAKEKSLSKNSTPVLTKVIFRPFNMGWACVEVGRRGSLLFARDGRTSLSALALFYVASHREV